MMDECGSSGEDDFIDMDMDCFSRTACERRRVRVGGDRVAKGRAAAAGNQLDVYIPGSNLFP